MLPAADAPATDRPRRIRHRARLVLVRPTHAAHLGNALSLKSDAAGAWVLLVTLHLGLTAAHARGAHGRVLAVYVRVDGGRGHRGKPVYVRVGGAHLVLVSLLLVVHCLLAVATIVEGVRSGLIIVAVIVEGVRAVVVKGPMLVPMLILFVLMPTVIGVVVLLALLLVLLQIPPLGILFLRGLLQAIPFLLLLELKIGVTTLIVLVPFQAHVPGRSGRDRHRAAAGRSEGGASTRPGG